MFHLLLEIIYMSFISLGLPDALLGAAWPVMYTEFAVPVSRAGMISMIICVGTTISSLMSDRLTRRFGTAKVTAFSVAMTAVALFGFSISHQFWMLCLWALPYGFGAGGVDASINNYVAIHYSSRHMSWLHCMWGLGASVGPYIMSWALTGGMSWDMGYRCISLMQMVLTFILFLSLPLWKGRTTAATDTKGKALPLKEVVKIKNAKVAMTGFFCYCAAENTAMLWSGSYLVLHSGMAEERAAFFAGMFFMGITLGRFINGFLTIKFTDTQLIFAGSGIMIAGCALMLLPLGEIAGLAGLGLFGFGCSPVYPCIIHSTPSLFGEEDSQALIGVQMAASYTGVCVMPPLFGLIAQYISISVMPVYMATITAVMVLCYKKLLNKG